jgi:peptidoglycan/xylan/chitin deacetylase (PgdA/CDA1 family)
MYHGFSDTGYHNGIENSSHNHVYIEYFKQQVGFLKKYYNVISLNEALEILRSGSRFKNNTIVMTIDDGYKSVFSLAFPVLKEFRQPCSAPRILSGIEHFSGATGSNTP